jgi:alpha-glucosidase
VDSHKPWWRSAVIYEVYVRSFADADGDGVGDLEGLRGRLPYLRELGVDALWLTPFYRSPWVDGGYDVADYRDVDPDFGDLAAFDALLADAHAADLRVIIDLVPNHSSAAHPWFVEALAAPPGSPERERYLFRDGRGAHGELPPNDWESIFGGPAWTRVPDGQWYLHLFDPAQPDLNWDDPRVHAEFESILRFWLDRGVDGFRVDVAHGMVKAAGLPDVGHPNQIGLLGKGRLPYFDQDGLHDIYRRWRRILDEYPGERIAVAEAWAETPQRLARYIAPDELHQAFNFDYLDAGWAAPALRQVIDDSLYEAGLVGAPTTWVLSNHDRNRHVTRYGGGEAGLRRARAAILLMLALPGSAYLYQGEELGLPEVLDLPDEVLTDPVWERSGHTDRGRDGCRVPLPWSGAEPPFGFGPGGRSWLPQPAGWRELTVARQQADPGSMLSLYRAALRVRADLPGLGDGPIRWLESAPDTLLFERPDGVRCLVNLGPAAMPVPDGYGPPLLASAELVDGAVPADTTVWWRLAD